MPLAGGEGPLLKGVGADTAALSYPSSACSHLRAHGRAHKGHLAVWCQGGHLWKRR